MEIEAGANQGYVKLWRKIRYCKALKEPGRPYSKFEAWIHLVAFEARGKPEPGLARGEFMASIRRLGKKWQWSNDKVLRFLRALEAEKMIAKAEHKTEQKAEHQIGHFIICKYEVYNPLPNTKPNTKQNGQPNTVINNDLNNVKPKLKGIEPAKPAVSPRILFEIYQAENKNLPEVQALTEDRLDKCRARINQASRNGCLSQYLKDFRKAVKTAQQLPFLCGKNERKWRAGFDWFTANQKNIYKVLEGNYDGAGPAPDTIGQGADYEETLNKTPADWSPELWAWFIREHGEEKANQLKKEYGVKEHAAGA